MKDSLVFDAPPLATVPVRGGGLFPVRRIYCVGRNYADHVREMGGDTREPPFFFQKPADAIVRDGATVAYPTCTSDFQHEVELVLAIGREGSAIARADAARHVWAAAVGIDLTRRDAQIDARKSGRPWEIGKSFDHSAPCGELVLLHGSLPTRGAIELRVNGQVRQRGDLAQLIWACDEIVGQLSHHYHLRPGDLVFTGTPAGVGPLVTGDHVEASIDGIGSLRIAIGDGPQ